MKKLKVMIVVGTRPEIIRLSVIINKLEASEAIEHVLVHTGQNYDYELNEVFFKDFNLRKSGVSTVESNVTLSSGSLMPFFTVFVFTCMFEFTFCIVIFYFPFRLLAFLLSIINIPFYYVANKFQRCSKIGK